MHDHADNTKLLAANIIRFATRHLHRHCEGPLSWISRIRGSHTALVDIVFERA
jgi:hypothetical protein